MDYQSESFEYGTGKERKIWAMLMSGALEISKNNSTKLECAAKNVTE